MERDAADRWRTLPALLLLLSPTLPLPVELVAGGEGSPESWEVDGLGGSGRSGMDGGEEVGVEPEPMKIADKGRDRDLEASAVRGGIGRSSARQGHKQRVGRLENDADDRCRRPRRLGWPGLVRKSRGGVGVTVHVFCASFPTRCRGLYCLPLLALSVTSTRRIRRRPLVCLQSSP